MYYTNINDYDQLQNTNHVQPSDFDLTTVNITLAIIVGLIATFFILS